MYLFGVHSNQCHHVPYPFQQAVKVEALITGNGDGVWPPGYFIHLLHTAHVDLVVHVQALDVPPIALQ